MNSVTTNYTLDLAAGLTQVLGDGTNTSLYGRGRIGEQQPGGFVVHLGDALGSVRQVRDASGEIVLAKDYEPYGEMLSAVNFRPIMVNTPDHLAYQNTKNLSENCHVGQNAGAGKVNKG